MNHPSAIDRLATGAPCDWIQRRSKTRDARCDWLPHIPQRWASMRLVPHAQKKMEDFGANLCYTIHARMGQMNYYSQSDIQMCGTSALCPNAPRSRPASQQPLPGPFGIYRQFGGTTIVA
jgi:hypothetical protein